MAGLDDFFAKKDKKRNKQARKFNTPDELAKRIEEPKPQPAAHRAPPDEPPPPPTIQEEDEWREVEVAKKADYTGLKIQHLTPGQESNTTVDGTISGGPNTTSDSKSKGPWNKAPEPVEIKAKVEEREPPPPSEVVLPPPPSSKAYISPSLRNKPPGYLDAPIRNKYGKLVAPDINNQDFFPSLGETRRTHHGGSGGGGGGTWSDAGRGAPPSSRPPPREVSLGNRYNPLTNDS